MKIQFKIIFSIKIYFYCLQEISFGKRKFYASSNLNCIKIAHFYNKLETKDILETIKTFSIKKKAQKLHICKIRELIKMSDIKIR